MDKKGTKVYTQYRESDGKWEVRRPDGQKASRVFETKIEAEAFSLQMSRREGLEHGIKGKNNKTQRVVNYDKKK